MVVPLFQRPYVWNEDNQWDPLWSDVIRVAERVLDPSSGNAPHFLGAVVLQQVPKNTGQMQERTIIDGQQRLTTLQLLLSALYCELLAAQATQPAMRIEPLIRNSEPFWSSPADQFKVWPTNRDRPAFNAIMGVKPPVQYDSIAYRSEKMVQAHHFFASKAREWLSADGSNALPARAAALETVVRDRLQMVVIDLAADENAQEIFETLNARGAPLSAADLIKNFVFQRLLETTANVEDAYQKYWKDFETGFWEKEISVGRLFHPRSAIFLNHWLISRTGKEVVAKEVFHQFKRFSDDAPVNMTDLLQQIYFASQVYRSFIDSASKLTGSIDRLTLFAYRTGVLESEVVKPLILCLLDPYEKPVPPAQLHKALEVLESWMVRRMLVRATTKGYNQVFAEMIAFVRASDRTTVGNDIEAYLAKQNIDRSYWPDDEEVQQELQNLQAYRRLRRARLRMVLEATEDYLRGWQDNKEALGQERVARGHLAIEHIMPRRWQTFWPLATGDRDEVRDARIHLLGNLTLLTSRLNSKVSNGPWLGNDGKRAALNKHDVLLLNRGIVKVSSGDWRDSWTDDQIKVRTGQLCRIILQIWPVPKGHRSGFASKGPRISKEVELSDLIASGALSPGASLFPKRKKHSARVAILLPDGRLEVEGTAFLRPTEAASFIVGKRTNGWSFFLVDQESKKSLRDLRREYIAGLAADAEYDEAEDDSDEDEDSVTDSV
ncbi:MAG TPA: DUF262 domain-containing protein [Xanthobacteraceae bacterium]|nr:DUF262 domain-containing protein [Xanthobacteraceae bacterium]